MTRLLSGIYGVALLILLCAGCRAAPLESQASAIIEPLPEDLTGLTQNRLYHLEDRGFFGPPANEWAAMLQALDLYMLERCRLGSLARSTNDVNLREFRLIATIGGHSNKSPYVIRLYWRKSRPFLSKYWMPRYSEIGFESAIQTASLPLTDAEAQTILTSLASMKFWEMPAINGDTPCCMDEGRRFLEGLSQGKYHCVDVGETHHAEYPLFLKLCAELDDLISQKTPDVTPPR